MSKNYCDNLGQRKTLLDELGGLPSTIVENQEWLYMLSEETRHSLSIEGYFATEQELKDLEIISESEFEEKKRSLLDKL